MGKCEGEKIAPYITLAGCFILNVPFGIVWYYGNLSTYTDSYLLYRVGPAAFNVPPQWLVSSFIISYVAGIFNADWLTSRFGAWPVELTTSLVFNSCTLLTYFSVQHSTAMMLLTFMVCTGFGAGLIGMITLVNVRKVMTNYVGLASSIVTSAFGVGSVIHNYTVTAYVNPDNLTPDVRHVKAAHFSQAKVLDNVPGVFVFTGLLSTGLHLLGYVLEHLPLMYLNRANEQHSLRNYEIDAPRAESYGSLNGDTTGEEKTVGRRDSQASKESSVPSLRPTEALRTKSLYAFWICSASLTYGVALTQNFYKLYGQLWIKDDAFLASVGSFSALSSAVCRLLTGFATDVIGVKRSLMAVMSLNSMLFPFWYLTPMISRWLFFFCCQILTGVQGTLFALCPMTALKLYGPTYYATNFGILLMASVVTCLACPELFTHGQDDYGLFSLVLLGTAISGLGLILLVVLMPEDRRES